MAATLADGQNLNFAIPVSYLRRILAEPLRQVTPLNATESSSGQSVLGRIGKSGNQGVIGRKREWSGTWDITLRLANQLNDPVKDVRCLFVFYDGSREPIDFVEGYFRDVIPPGLAKRLEQSTYRRSEDMSALYGLSRLIQTLEIRVLDFQIVKDQKKAQSPLKFSQFRVCNILEDARQLKVTSSFLREDARLPLHSRLRYASRCCAGRIVISPRPRHVTMQHVLSLYLIHFKGVLDSGEAKGRHHNFSKMLEIKGYEVFWVDH